MSTIPYFLENPITDSGEFVSITGPAALYSQKDLLVLIWARAVSKPQRLVRLEGLYKLKNFNNLVGPLISINTEIQ
jgi:hypothetical protein